MFLCCVEGSGNIANGDRKARRSDLPGGRWDGCHHGHHGNTVHWQDEAHDPRQCVGLPGEPRHMPRDGSPWPCRGRAQAPPVSAGRHKEQVTTWVRRLSRFIHRQSTSEVCFWWKKPIGERRQGGSLPAREEKGFSRESRSSNGRRRRRYWGSACTGKGSRACLSRQHELYLVMFQRLEWQYCTIVSFQQVFAMLHQLHEYVYCDCRTWCCHRQIVLF